MYVCIGISKYINVHIHVDLHIHTICICIRIHKHIHILKHIHIHKHIHTYIHCMNPDMWSPASPGPKSDSCAVGFSAPYCFAYIVCVCIQLYYMCIYSIYIYIHMNMYTCVYISILTRYMQGIKFPLKTPYDRGRFAMYSRMWRWPELVFKETSTAAKSAGYWPS